MLQLKSNIPSELKQKFIKDFVNRYTEKFPPNDNDNYILIRSEIIMTAAK